MIVLARTDPKWAAEPDPETLGKTYHEDGSWTWNLPEDFDPEVRLGGKFLTWRYDGQVHHRDDAAATADQVQFIAEAPQEIPLKDKLLRGLTVDRYGRRWVPEDVDLDELAKVYGGPLPETATVHDSGFEVGELVTWEPHASWHNYDCLSDIAGDDTHVWDTEGRELVTGLNSRSKAIVQLDMGPGEKSCTGVLVQQDGNVTAGSRVLTAGPLPVQERFGSIRRVGGRGLAAPPRMGLPTRRRHAPGRGLHRRSGRRPCRSRR